MLPETPFCPPQTGNANEVLTVRRIGGVQGMFPLRDHP
jgi:hypothetical protein